MSVKRRIAGEVKGLKPQVTTAYPSVTDTWKTMTLIWSAPTTTKPYVIFSVYLIVTNTISLSFLAVFFSPKNPNYDSRINVDYDDSRIWMTWRNGWRKWKTKLLLCERCRPRSRKRWDPCKVAPVSLHFGWDCLVLCYFCASFLFYKHKKENFEDFLLMILSKFVDEKFEDFINWILVFMRRKL